MHAGGRRKGDIKPPFRNDEGLIGCDKPDVSAWAWTETSSLSQCADRPSSFLKGSGAKTVAFHTESPGSVSSPSSYFRISRMPIDLERIMRERQDSGINSKCGESGIMANYLGIIP